MKMAPPYSGLEAGSYAVLALATRFDDAIPEALSALMVRADQLPAVVDLGESFLALPAAGDWRPVDREVAGARVEGATLHRAVFAGPQGRWFVWLAGAADPAATLPFPPQGAGDLAADASAAFEAVRLPEGVSLDDLAGEGGAGDLLDVDNLATGFSRIPL